MSLPPRIEIGQIARLLPSLDVAAISQASSPESNPSLPLPVTALAGHDPANKLIGQRTEWHAAPLRVSGRHSFERVTKAFGLEEPTKAPWAPLDTASQSPEAGLLSHQPVR